MPLATAIIPVWGDLDRLPQLLRAFPRRAEAEIIVACTNEESARARPLESEFDWVRWVAGPRGRAAQMNAGAGAAHGRWLVFLHADSRLPPDWLDVIAGVDREASTVGGAFRFTLDSADWRARALEMAVRWRVRVLGLPYGDQALFVRRSVFDGMGGYADLPLMEDLDLVRRLRRLGRLHYSASPVVTSARRWERDGWLRRSGENVGLAARFLLGASPARLAQRYFGRTRTALVMMARAPWTGGKTRIPSPDEASHAALRHALFFDTLDRVRSVGETDHLVACEPAAETVAMRAVVGPGTDVIAQRGLSLGDRLTHVFADVFRLGYERVVVIGSDLPDLPTDRLQSAAARLLHGDRVVLGPAADGGYYLVGLSAAHPELFRDVDWGGPAVLAQTLERAAALDLPAVLLDQWSDVDDAGDLRRLLEEPGGAAVRTRDWATRVAPPDARTDP